jgi:hypothetical protein
MTKLKALIKAKFSRESAKLYLETLNRYKENEWVTPNNYNAVNLDLSRFQALNEYGLVEMKRTPMYNEHGIYVGMHITFRYRQDLKY